MSRVRRTTAAIGVAAIASAVGLGMLVGTKTTAHRSQPPPPAPRHREPDRHLADNDFLHFRIVVVDVFGGCRPDDDDHRAPTATTTKPVTVSRQS